MTDFSSAAPQRTCSEPAVARRTGTTMEIAQRTAQALQAANLRVVFAESCTCGMVACELGKVPGISNHLCGSAVTYRDDTKVRWLGIDGDVIKRETAVCQSVAIAMARGVLERTPEASLAVSITGHLGPGADEGFDGVVFIGVAKRAEDGTMDAKATRHQLAQTDRPTRQIEATGRVLETVLETIETS